MEEWIYSNINLNSVGSVCSIIGLIVTVFLSIQAWGLRKVFVRKVRLPDLIKELEKTYKNFTASLKGWDKDKQSSLAYLTGLRSLLKNLEPKLTKKYRNEVRNLINKIQPSYLMIFKNPISSISKDHAWELSAELNGLIVFLKQIQKDLHWDLKI